MSSAEWSDSTQGFVNLVEKYSAIMFQGVEETHKPLFFLAGCSTQLPHPTEAVGTKTQRVKKVVVKTVSQTVVTLRMLPKQVDLVVLKKTLDQCGLE